jgi:hypothetical protein
MRRTISRRARVFVDLTRADASHFRWYRPAGVPPLPRAPATKTKSKSKTRVKTAPALVKKRAPARSTTTTTSDAESSTRAGAQRQFSRFLASHLEMRSYKTTWHTSFPPRNPQFPNTTSCVASCYQLGKQTHPETATTTKVPSSESRAGRGDGSCPFRILSSTNPSRKDNEGEGGK